MTRVNKSNDTTLFFCTLLSSSAYAPGVFVLVVNIKLYLILKRFFYSSLVVRLSALDGYEGTILSSSLVSGISILSIYLLRMYVMLGCTFLPCSWSRGRSSTSLVTFLFFVFYVTECIDTAYCTDHLRWDGFFKISAGFPEKSFCEEGRNLLHFSVSI